MALTNATVVPKVIAAQLLLAFRERRVYANRVNNTWRNALNGGGNEVIINRPLPGSVGDYSRTTRINYNQDADVNTAGLTLNLGGSADIGGAGAIKYWHVKFDDLDRALADRDLLQSSIVEYGEALANAVDDDVRTVMQRGAPTLPAVNIDLDGIAAAEDGLDKFSFEVMHKALDWKRVPRAGRWIIAGPAFLEALQKSILSSETMLATPQQASLANGRVGTLAGFTIYLGDPKNSKFENAVSSGPAQNQHKSRYVETVMVGVDSATAYIDRLSRTERLRLESHFSDAVRGLYEYNAKVLQPERLLKRDYRFEGDAVTQLTLPATIT